MTQKGPPPAVYDRPSVDLDPLFSAAGHLTGIDPMLLKAVAMQESSLDPSHWNPSSHAVGLMELEPQNWKSLGVTDPWDPAQNIMGGALLLRDNLKMYDGDLSKALQQYNGGNPSRWGAATQAYVRSVRGYYEKFAGSQAPDVLPQFIQTPPPPMLRPDTASAPLGHLNMNSGPSDQPNFAQNHTDPLTMAQLFPPAAHKAGVQPVIAPATGGPVPQPQPSSLSPSTFVRAFLTNAIFGGNPPPYAFALEPGIRSDGSGWR